MPCRTKNSNCKLLRRARVVNDQNDQSNTSDVGALNSLSFSITTVSRGVDFCGCLFNSDHICWCILRHLCRYYYGIINNLIQASCRQTRLGLFSKLRPMWVFAAKSVEAGTFYSSFRDGRRIPLGRRIIKEEVNHFAQLQPLMQIAPRYTMQGLIRRVILASSSYPH